MVFQQRALKTNKQKTKPNKIYYASTSDSIAKLHMIIKPLPEIQLKPTIANVMGHDPKPPSLQTHPRSPAHISTLSIYTYLPGKMIQDLGTEQENTEPE